MDEWLPIGAGDDVSAGGNVSSGLVVGLENLFQTKDEAMMRGYARQVGAGQNTLSTGHCLDGGPSQCLGVPPSASIHLTAAAHMGSI